MGTAGHNAIGVSRRLSLLVRRFWQSVCWRFFSVTIDSLTEAGSRQACASPVSGGATRARGHTEGRRGWE